MKTALRFLIGFILCTAGPVTATWHIVYNQPVNYNLHPPLYDGFPSRFVYSVYNTTVVNGHQCSQSCLTPPPNGSLDIYQVYEAGVFNQSALCAPSSSYWDYQVHGVGKMFFGQNRMSFKNPENGQLYPFVLFSESQYLLNSDGSACGNNAFGSSFSTDGVRFTETKAALIRQCNTNPGQLCAGTDWFCDHGFPCSAAGPQGRQWWTIAEIISPIVYTDNNFYALTFLYYNNPDPNLTYADCSQEDSLCYPANPLHGGTNAYVLSSSDGITWSRYPGKISSAGIDHTSPCYKSSWLINVDWAYDPAADDFYMTRSYSTSYQGSCTPATLPDHIQLYKVHGYQGLFSGTWTLLFDGGCSNLGFQPDSAEIVHDGLGRVVHGAGGSVTLMMGASTGGACGLSSSAIHQVEVAP